MDTTVIGKNELQIALEFIKTIPENNFVVGIQTDREENVGKLHCVLGHLGVNPASPFYNEKSITNSSGNKEIFISDQNHIAYKINYLVVDIIEYRLHLIHNGEVKTGIEKIDKQETPKGRTIEALKEVISKID